MELPEWFIAANVASIEISPAGLAAEVTVEARLAGLVAEVTAEVEVVDLLAV